MADLAELFLEVSRTLNFMLLLLAILNYAWEQYFASW